MKTYKTAEYSFSISRPSYAGNSVKLAYFTDMHNCCSPKEAEELEGRLFSLEPDLVLCGGDSIIARPGEPVERSVKFLQRIAGRFPLIIGTGNHEYRSRLYPETYGSMYASYKEPLLQTENVFLLENKDQIFMVGDLPVHIYGFDLPRQYYRRFRGKKHIPPEEISSVFRYPDRDAVTVLLSHNPSSLQACMKWGADLSLSGHYHGGIMRIGKHSGLISPEFRPFPNDVYGHFQTDGKHGIISSGCGEHTIPLRILNPREIVGIRISITD